MTFSESMRAAAEDTWNAALDHRFFREVATDAIEDRAFERYLRVEYGFVDCAAIVMGYAVAKAPTFAERVRLALGLHGLVTDQHDFFVAAFEQIGAGADSRTGLPPDARSAPLHDLFLDTARSEGYEEILSCVLAAEWLYLTWCSRAHRSPSRRAYISDWVAIHAGGAFAETVNWVRSELDARGPFLPHDRQMRLRTLFEAALAAEISFHDAVYI
jgi:thiaminase (transcriptional activator TenA)